METAGQYQFAPEERPIIPGGPFSPAHPPMRRLGYGVVGIAAGLAATFPNGLIQTNVSNLSGPLGVYVAQAALLPAIYVAMNAIANLSLVKAHQVRHLSLDQFSAVVLRDSGIASNSFSRLCHGGPGARGQWFDSRKSHPRGDLLPAAGLHAEDQAPGAGHRYGPAAARAPTGTAGAC